MSDDPFLLTHRFSVEVSVGPLGLLGTVIPALLSTVGAPTGIDIHGYFTEVEGLDSEVGIIEYKTVTVFGERVTQKIPGPPTWGNITLHKGVTGDMGFWIWHEMVQKGFVSVARANVTIMMHDLLGEAVARWDVDKAWPAKISGPHLNAAEDTAAVETIVLAHEGLRRVSTGVLGSLASNLTNFL